MCPSGAKTNMSTSRRTLTITPPPLFSYQARKVSVAMYMCVRGIYFASVFMIFPIVFCNCLDSVVFCLDSEVFYLDSVVFCLAHCPNKIPHCPNKIPHCPSKIPHCPNKIPH
jgi:hypothetical protein